jgi:hypothetical protein
MSYPKERPIIMQAESVRAILDGTKTQTRREVKGAPIATESGRWSLISSSTDKKTVGLHCYSTLDPQGHSYTERGRESRTLHRSPYGQPGGRLWVRESWTQYPVEISPEPCDFWHQAGPRYPAICCGWKSPLFMPRIACRLVLEVVSVRVERLQQITEGDAIAEGCLPCRRPTEGSQDGYSHGARTAYSRLWNSINGDRASWAVNPWVWVVTFGRVGP